MAFVRAQSTHTLLHSSVAYKGVCSNHHDVDHKIDNEVILIFPSVYATCQMDPWVEMFENITNSRSANCTRYNSCNAETCNNKSDVDIISCNIPISDTDCYQQSSIIDSYKQQSLNIEVRIMLHFSIVKQ